MYRYRSLLYRGGVLAATDFATGTGDQPVDITIQTTNTKNQNLVVIDPSSKISEILKNLNYQFRISEPQKEAEGISNSSINALLMSANTKSPYEFSIPVKIVLNSNIEKATTGLLRGFWNNSTQAVTFTDLSVDVQSKNAADVKGIDVISGSSTTF